MSHNVPYKSDTKTIVPGAPMDLFDFVPIKGPNGGRVCVDKFILVVTGTITVATAVFNGIDVARLAQLITIEQRDGKQRWNLSGYKSRMASIYFHGIEAHVETANIAIGAGQAVDWRLVIPMTKPYIRRGKDFALPADIFRKITLTWAATASAQTGTTVLSAETLSCYVLAEWHEEDSVEFKAEDIIKSVDFNSSTQARLALNGVVHDLLIMKEGTTAGGDVVSAVTDVRCEDLGTPLLTRLDLKHSYTVKRKIGASGPTTLGTERFSDPVRSDFLIPFFCADNDTSLWDGKATDALKIDVGTGLAGMSVISREVVEKSQANYNAQVARWGVQPKGIRMKTQSKSRRGLSDGWSKRQMLVGVWSAPLAKAA